jgi:branched-chain amino acid transport system permease protein
MSAQELVQQAINGLSLGSTYALLALGLAMVFSIVGLINFAHGELLTLGGYAAWVTLGHGVPWPLAIPIVLAVVTLAAVAMERIAFRRFYGTGLVTLLLTSFAISFLLQTAFSIGFGAQAKAVDVPGWASGVVSAGAYSVPVIQLITTVVTAVCLVGLLLLLRFTTIGIAMRAAAEDFAVVRLMGLSATKVAVVAFTISGLLAGVASLLLVARSGSIEPASGVVPLIKAFIAVIIGGIGSLAGAVVGGLLLGFTEVILQAVLPHAAAPFSDAFALCAVIAVLLVKPQGIFGQAEARA